MTVSIDTNVLVRLLVRDDETQYASARLLVDDAAALDEPVLVTLCALMETEWVLRSRYKLDKSSIAKAFTQLLETSDVIFEHEPTVEETLHMWSHHPSSDFSDCLLAARSIHLGSSLFMTFDVGAARLPGARLLLPPAAGGQS